MIPSLTGGRRISRIYSGLERRTWNHLHAQAVVCVCECECVIRGPSGIRVRDSNEVVV